MTLYEHLERGVVPEPDDDTPGGERYCGKMADSRGLREL